MLGGMRADPFAFSLGGRLLVVASIFREMGIDGRGCAAGQF